MPGEIPENIAGRRHLVSTKCAPYSAPERKRVGEKPAELFHAEQDVKSTKMSRRLAEFTRHKPALVERPHKHGRRRCFDWHCGELKAGRQRGMI